MQFNPDIHHRKSIRLPHYDYSQNGLYFVTLCAQYRQLLFGEIADGVMNLNQAGIMVDAMWQELVNKFPMVRLHKYVVMPNHFHGVVEIVGAERAESTVGADLRVCPDKGAHIGAPLHEIVQWFKTMTTNAYLRGIKNSGWAPFDGRLWQRNYYEHIIRNEPAYLKIAEYIQTNPLKWLDDTYYLHND